MKSMENLPQAATCQSELERVFIVLQRIENRLFSPEPIHSSWEESNNKLSELRDDISSIADRLQVIDDKLGVLGK